MGKWLNMRLAQKKKYFCTSQKLKNPVHKEVSVFSSFLNLQMPVSNLAYQQGYPSFPKFKSNVLDIDYWDSFH